MNMSYPTLIERGFEPELLLYRFEREKSRLEKFGFNFMGGVRLRYC